jgi:hypothetical protein
MGSRSSPSQPTVSPQTSPPDRSGRHQKLAIALNIKRHHCGAVLPSAPVPSIVVPRPLLSERCNHHQGSGPADCPFRVYVDAEQPRIGSARSLPFQLRSGRSGTTRGFRSGDGSFNHASYARCCSALSKNNHGGGTSSSLGSRPALAMSSIATTASDSGQEVL